MKHERVNAQNLDPIKLGSTVRTYLGNQGFKIVDEETYPGYYAVHARKGGVARTAIGAVRDVEVEVVGDKNSSQITLRTGAWGRDIAVPALEGFIILGPIGAAGGAVAGAVVAHEFEAHFWKWLDEEARRNAGAVGAPYTPPLVPAGSNAPVAESPRVNP